MCIICQEWESNKITAKEAFKAIGDTMNPKNQKHLEGLSEKILQKEVPETEVNTEIDEAFWNATHQED